MVPFIFHIIFQKEFIIVVELVSGFPREDWPFEFIPPQLKGAEKIFFTSSSLKFALKTSKF